MTHINQRQRPLLKLILLNLVLLLLSLVWYWLQPQRNVILQLHNLQSYPFVHQAIAANQLAVHGWVYDLHQQHIRFYDPATDTFVVA